jgi:hypothetical protein
VSSVAFSAADRLVETCDEHAGYFLWQGSEPEKGPLLGSYIAPYKVDAIYWQNVPVT